MNKRVLFTCVLLVLLTVGVAGCKLPASSPPPTITTQQPIAPTATTGIAAEATFTSAPPTAVLVTTTPVPTTAPPPTQVPPTPAPPTPAPLPPASRIQFAAGGTGAVVEGVLDSGQTLYYVLAANATQTMSVKIQSPNGDVYLGVFGVDGYLLLPSAQQTTWSGTLPTTQDYYLSVTTGDGKESYTLSVDIPPIAAGPTANVTPAAGPFDPVATYGTATFDDPMNGGNMSDWVKPETGLLPNTNYLKISVTDGKFYVTGKVPGFSTWYFTWHELSDFYLQSKFDSGSCTGKDAYGLIIRGPEHQAGVSYGYVVAFSCDGSLHVFRLDGANPYTTVELVSWSPSSYIIAGTNKQNIMGIKAIGNTLTIYANGYQIAEIFDNKYTFGRYGVFVSPDTTANYTYRVIQMSYWDLKP
jgi:hypothetical protein